MENRKFDYFSIGGFIILIIGVLREIFIAGYSNVRVYQVLMIIFFSISLIYKIKDVMKKNKNDGID